MQTYDSHYINGQWVKAQSSAVFEVHDSSTEEVFATVPQGTRAEAEQAVLAARAAFDSWSQLPVETRCGYIDKIVEGLKARTDEMGTAIAREVGMPLKLAKMIQVGGPVFNWSNACGCGRLHHALEFPAQPNHAQGGVCDGGGLHRGAQTQRNRAHQRHDLDRHHPRRRLACRGVQSGERHWARGRRSVGLSP